MHTRSFSVTALFLLFSSAHISGAVLRIPSDTLNQWISTEQSVNFNFLLVDIRPYTEVESGIIASEYCKPYHLSIGTNELQDNYTRLPKDVPIILYCKSGGRIPEALTFLLGKDFTYLGYLDGGVDEYHWPLHDSIEFKPLSLLPEPSYIGNTSVIWNKPNHLFRGVPTAEGTPQFFTLQGRLFNQFSARNSVRIYVLERVCRQSSGNISGFNRPADKQQQVIVQQSP